MRGVMFYGTSAERFSPIVCMTSSLFNSDNAEFDK